MPIRAELAMPSVPQATVVINRDLLAVSIFSALGLALSFALIAYTDTFEQMADLAGAYLGG